MRQATLIIMAKSPRAGRVKTRLGRDIGAGAAAQVFRILLERTLFVAAGGPWRTLAAIDPVADIQDFARRFPGVAVIAQTQGDLGARITAAMNTAPKGPVAVIGADCPAIQTSHIRCAFRALGRSDAVFGPAADGGFWLVGLARRRRAPLIFEGVRWSTEAALADTVDSLPESFAVTTLEQLGDIDDGDDLRAAGPIMRSIRQR